MTKIRVTLWITLLIMILTIPNGLSFAQSDTDGDGFTDDVDQCINDPGHSTAFGIGCPDRDGDGWHDWDDACPDQYGTSWLEPTRGCPDSDGDGFADMSDSCPSEYGQYNGCANAPVQPTQPPPPTDPPPAPPQPTAIPVVATNAPPRNNAVPVVVTPAPPIPCELITIDSTPADIFDSPNEAGDIVGQIDPNTPYTVYGLQLPTDWYLIDGGWVKSEGVMISGDCGGLVGLTITDSPITVDEFDPTTAQSYCLELAELDDPVCFYHTLQGDIQVICMMQNMVMNCEMGNGALLTFFQQIFKTGLSPAPRIDGLASVTGDGGVTSFDDNQAYPDCAELMSQFLAPYLGTDATISFRLQGEYIVGFLPLDEASLEEIETPPCQNMTTHATPVVVNGEIVRDFITQQVMTQYEAWTPNGWDNMMTDAGEMPLVALLLPSRQRLFAKQGALATTPIRIDFLNQLIIFGDGSIFFGFNTAQFTEQVKNLTGFEWITP